MARRLTVLLTMLLATMGVAGLTAGTAEGVTAQFTLFDATASNTATAYYQPAFTSPANWTSPINYAGGTALWRLQILSKPSTLPIQAQFCMWRSNFTVETCSGLSTTITTAGTYWINLGTPNNWWKLNGNWSYATPPQNVRIMIKDQASQMLLLRSPCGNFCYPRNDLNLHVPISINSQLIFVAPGATLDPPANWSGCPTAWSPACTTGGTTGTTGSTSSTTTTATTAPPGSTSTTTNTTVGGGVTVSIADGTVVEPDTGYRSLPFKVFLNRASTSPVRVNATIFPGTATAPSDYGNRGGPVAVTIPAGQTSAWVGFPVWGDNVKEANETVSVRLSSPVGATINRGTAKGTIVNDD